MTVLDVEARLDALYAGPLDDFVAARDALARDIAASGDRVGSERVKRLRRPTLAAWAANQVVRAHADEVRALAVLGDELRAATAARDRGRIKALDRLRRERTEAVLRPLRDAGQIAGRPVSTDVLDRLSETLTAAVMDADAAVVVRAGRLAQALQHVGFGVVDEGGDEADVVALRTAVPDVAADRSGVPAPGGARHRDTEGSPTSTSLDDPAATDRAAADREVESTAAEVDRIEALRDNAEARLRDAQEVVARHRAELERLAAELERLTIERDAVVRRSTDARQTEQEARAEVAALDAELDRAERRAAAARRARRDAARRD